MTGLPVVRVEVTRPDGSTFITHVPVAATRYRPDKGYRLRQAWGYPYTDGFTTHLPEGDPR